jgi:hypothetical protein
MTDLNLPEPIAAYFDADKRDGEAVARCFTKQAVVKDEGQTYSGTGPSRRGRPRRPPGTRTPRAFRRGTEGREMHRHMPADRRFGAAVDFAIRLPPRARKDRVPQITA